MFFNMAKTSAQKAEEKQKIVWVSPTTIEEKKRKYDERSEKALDEMEALQPRKRTVVKDRKTALRATWPLNR